MSTAKQSQSAAPKLKKPPLYNVVILNDDTTPMDFVVWILIDFFGFSEEIANKLMLQVHNQGSAICATLYFDYASSKAAQVCEIARHYGHELLCVTELSRD